ncbi:MAG: carboxypeptidase-like regulatory domain-containing protein [Thermoplasmatota archaeon]
MKSGLLFLLLTTSLLAGCTGSDGGGDALSGDDDELGGLDVEATDTTGVIRGVVVDDAIRPVAEATVKLSGGGINLETITNEEGAFGFEGLDPGTYFLRGSKLGYFESQASVEVVAGVDLPPVTKLLLETDAEGTPFYVLYDFRGFVECGTSAVALCGAPYVAVQIADLLLNETGQGPTGIGNPTNDNFLQAHVIERAPALVQGELIWQSTQALGDHLTYYHSYTGKDHIGIQGTIHSVTGTSPLLIQTDADLAATVDLGPTTDLTVRVFAAGGDLPAGVVVQQEFQSLTHVFYGYTPPEDWRFTTTGDVPQP